MQPLNQNLTIAFESPLSKAVREGRCGSDPRIVPEFIRSQTLTCTERAREAQWQVQKEIVELLFETIADPLIASCWRNWCQQCCCMPLHTLRCLSQTRTENNETKRLEIEMRTLKEYYLPLTP